MVVSTSSVSLILIEFKVLATLADRVWYRGAGLGGIKNIVPVKQLLDSMRSEATQIAMAMSTRFH